jgi:long-chain fatty acid transport protein
MRKLGRIAAHACAFVIAGGAVAHAGGFELYEESPAGVAMVGALTALPLDASTIFYNPAGMVALSGGAALVGAGIAFGQTTATLPATTMPASAAIVTDATVQAFALPEVFVSQHIGRRVAAGIGVFTQFGNGIEWPDGTQNGMSVPFPGRFLALSTQLTTVTINPSVAVRITDQISVGAGVDVILAAIELRKAIALGDAESSAHLGGTAQGVGINVGVLAEVVRDRLSLGLSYRSGTLNDFTFTGTAHFDTSKVPELQSVLVDQGASVSLPLPHNVSMGVAFRPVARLTLALDAHVTVWSSLQQLVVNFDKPGTPALAQTLAWRDSVSVRLGGQLVPVDGLALRLGVGYEKSPVPIDTLDPTVPVSDRYLVTGGVGYTVPTGKAHGLGFGVGYIAGISADRTATRPDFPATYSQVVHLVSLAVSYEWGAPARCCCQTAKCASCAHCAGANATAPEPATK